MAIIQQIYFFHPILMKLGCCCCLAWTLFVLAFQCHEKINWIFFQRHYCTSQRSGTSTYVHTMYVHGLKSQ